MIAARPLPPEWALGRALAEYDAGLLTVPGKDPPPHAYDWYNEGGCEDQACRYHARPKQHPPKGDWSLWLIYSGRGWGKNRTAAEWVRLISERVGRIALVGETAADARDVMVEGEAGIMSISPPWNRPNYEPSKRRLTWPNGAMATTYSADDPEQLRGPSHEAAWGDEVAKWRYPETWDNLMLGMRLGTQPRVLATTTPRPTKLIKALKEKAVASDSFVVGHTLENVDNLAPTFRENVLQSYEGTRLGRQELAGEILEDVEGALWQLGWIDAARVIEAPPLARVVTAVDPAVTHGEDSDYTGIAVCGKAESPCAACRERGYASDYYVLHSGGYKLSPDGWARRAVDLNERHGGDRIIAERNNGGEMVEQTINRAAQPGLVKTIVASRGKAVRAEPVAALYEQGRVHHVGVWPSLEEQQTTFPVSAEHDDEVDALVYAITELSGTGQSITAY